MEETSIVGERRRRIPLEVMKSFFSEKELDNLQNIAESGIMLQSELEPFIFDNEYDELATDMGMCIEEVENSGC